MPAHHPVLTRRVVAMVLALPLASAALAGDEDWADTWVLAGPCANCHGLTGNSPGAIPSLGGLSEDELVARMTAFREGTADATVMTRLMKGYDDEQIAALAGWFTMMSETNWLEIGVAQ